MWCNHCRTCRDHTLTWASHSCEVRFLALDLVVCNKAMEKCIDPDSRDHAVQLAFLEAWLTPMLDQMSHEFAYNYEEINDLWVTFFVSVALLS